MLPRRKKPRCKNTSPSQHPSYRGKRCQRRLGHDGMCWVRIGLSPYKHYWDQAMYERLGQATKVE
jgi:hypothetical protein